MKLKGLLGIVTHTLVAIEPSNYSVINADRLSNTKDSE